MSERIVESTENMIERRVEWLWLTETLTDGSSSL